MKQNLLIGLTLITLSGCASAGVQSSPAPSETHTASPSAPHTAVTLLDLQGSGTKSTNKFTAASDWDLNWSYDCASFGFSGNFIVSIYNGDGSPSSENQSINQLGMKGQDVQHYHHGGEFYFEVSSECKWHIVATG